MEEEHIILLRKTSDTVDSLKDAIVGNELKNIKGIKGTLRDHTEEIKDLRKDMDGIKKDVKKTKASHIRDLAASTIASGSGGVAIGVAAKAKVATILKLLGLGM